jgi:hypothetical protein
MVVQQTLLTKCEQSLPPVLGTTGKDWILMGKQWSLQYHECSITHNGLVDAVNQYNLK